MQPQQLLTWRLGERDEMTAQHRRCSSFGCRRGPWRRTATSGASAFAVAAAVSAVAAAAHELGPPRWTGSGPVPEIDLAAVAVVVVAAVAGLEECGCTPTPLLYTKQDRDAYAWEKGMFVSTELRNAVEAGKYIQ